MKIFVSWSGDLSHDVAVALRGWLPVVLPDADPWVSSEDIPKGSRWATELATQLDTTNCGILCITPQNAQEAWINFEAGALSKTVAQAQIHPFLLGLRPEDLTGPLAQFQITEFERTDVAKLVRALNSAAGAHQLSHDRLEHNVRTCWPILEASLAELTARALSPAHEVGSDTFDTAPELSDEQVAVLRTVMDATRSGAVHISEVLSMHRERARYFADQLEELDLLERHDSTVSGRSWSLSARGREELVRRGML